MKENMNWEAYKLLSRSVVSEEELDIFYYLTHCFLKESKHDSFSEGLDDLLFRSSNEKIVADVQTIKAHIASIDIKKEP